MILENFPTEEILSKHFYDQRHTNSVICYDSLKKQVEHTQAQEFSEAFLDKNLENSQYASLSFLDFFKFDKLLRQRRTNELKEWSQFDFTEYKKQILAGVTTGSLPPPIILHDITGKYVLFSGEARLLAFKVLGIRPVVKIVNVEQVLVYNRHDL